MPKYPRYQDYVIRNGKFIGDFETMYQDYDDPWEQSTRENKLSYKSLVIRLCEQYEFKTVMELGSGHGHFAAKIQEKGIRVVGVDISPSAVSKAASLYPQCEFVVGDILDFDLYTRILPDCIILSEITWYILDKLDDFLILYHKIQDVTKARGGIWLLHLLATYPPGVQQYGVEKFSDLEGILRYFNLDYEEYGSVVYKSLAGASRTWFLGKPFS